VFGRHAELAPQGRNFINRRLHTMMAMCYIVAIVDGYDIIFAGFKKGCIFASTVVVAIP
jgi:cytochrome b subunit of formate dehydrogenase